VSYGKYSIIYPVRIASLSPAATEILFRMGKGKEIVCTDQFSNFPEDAKRIPHLKDHQKVRIADVQEHAPELILTATVIQKQLADMLRAAALPAVHQDPRTLNAIYEDIKALGILVQAEKESKELVEWMKKEFAAVQQKVKLLPRKAKVYVEEWHLPPMASGNWVPEVVALAGGIPFPIKSGELSREVTLAEVQAFDPDLIVVSWCGAGHLADKNLFMNREGWGVLRAVRDGRVKVIDDSLLNRPGPRLTDGAKMLYGWIFEMLH